MNEKGGDLASFLQKLGEDSELQQAYAKDPRGTMQQAGLADDVIDATMSRDLGRIKSVLSSELGAEAHVMMVLTDPNV
jgi:hypothetical protein